MGFSLSYVSSAGELKSLGIAAHTRKVALLEALFAARAGADILGGYVMLPGVVMKLQIAGFLKKHDFAEIQQP